MLKLFVLLACATTALATWKEVTTLNIVALDLHFPDDVNGYISGGVNGNEGVVLAKTTDSGKTWINTMIPNTTLPLSISMAVSPPNVLVNTLFSNYISHDDGKTWAKTKGADVSQAMSAKFVHGKFYIPGTGLLWGNGVAVSDDNGTSFRGVKIDGLKENCFPRWAAHPTPTTWYVAAGSQPQQGPPPSGGNYAQMMKTTDAGKTWTSQYYSAGKFYFMDIDCADENTCCVNSEADTMSSQLGIAIYCTHDGKTWNATYTDYTPGQSLMDMKYLGNQNWVASGTFDASGAVRPTFVRSSDNGHTWTPESETTTPQVAIVAASFPTPSSGYALGIDRFNSEMLIKYTA